MHVIIGVFFLGLAALAFTIAGYLILRGSATLEWAQTEGEVMRSRMLVSVSESIDEGDTYQAEVIYIYMVNGKRYEGSRVSVGSGLTSSSDQRLAKQILDRYPKGSQVTVHYNPDKPEDAMLETGIRWMGVVTAFVMGLLMLMLGLPMFLDSPFA